jgi:hypothetical protein
MTTREIGTRFVVPALILAALVVPAVVLSSRLPDPIAIHWSLDGRPNGFGPWWLVTVLLSVLWCAGWAALQTNRGNRWSATSVYAIGGALLSAHTLGLLSNLDRGSGRDAAVLPGSPGMLLIIVAGMVVLGALGWVLAGPDSPVPDSAAPPLPTVRLGAAEQAVWTGRAHNAVLPGIAMAAAVLLFVLSGRAPLILCAVVILIVLIFSAVRVVAGPRGVQVRLGVFGWPRQTVPLSEIADARSISLAPLEFGGWGWRVRPGRRAVIIRGGPAIDLRLRDGKRFLITVDDAERAAGLVNDYLARTAS